MEVIVAKTVGFCSGVKRAVEQVYEQIDAGVKPIYTFDPVIHNEEVVRDSEEEEVSVLHTEEELLSLQEGTAIIRPYGVGKRIYKLLESRGIHVADTICPFIKRIHGVVERQNQEGRHAIIIEDENHPEVQGTEG